MNNLTLNKDEVKRWFSDRGDYTHNITYGLTEDSNVIDLGGFTGLWAKQIIEQYNPNMYIIEPIDKFYNGMVDTFKGNSKVNLLNVAVGTENKDGVIHLNGDATSTNISIGESVNIKYKTMKTLLDTWKLESVDLIQINIEGDEYVLLEDMLESGLINKFNNIQVQFHYGIDDDVNRRDKIQQGLIYNGFKEKFNYPFVWECWTKL
jgi:FkbM family methyltransferase